MDASVFLPKCPSLSLCPDSFRFAENADFWRLHLDDGSFREICVRSSAQTEPEVTVDDGKRMTLLIYRALRADDGKTYDVTLTVHIEEEENKKRYFAEITNNHPGLRVNELQLPFFDFDRMASERADEVLYIPCSLGERIPNPRDYVQRFHTEYSAADDKEIWRSYDYGGSLTMSFYGVQSGDAFFYVSRKDPAFSICAFCVGTPPRGCDKTLRLTVSEYPLVTTGESVITAPVEAAIFQGDWRQGAEDYRAWTKTWAPAPKKPRWVREMTGWQRIIMKHQYGEIFCRYADLPRLWEEGAGYGVTTMLLFGWWKGCFDNGYPVYEPDEEMGGADALRDAIKTINEKGGHVLLYANGRLIDVKSQCYKAHRQEVCQIGIDGFPYIERYQFSNRGTLLRQYGYITFAIACQATDLWADTLANVAETQLSLGSNGCFFDQIGGAITKPCFNPAHKHGLRGAVEAPWRIDNLNRIQSMLTEDQALASENVCDIFATRVHFLHGGCGGCWRTPTQYPYMFRSVFPDVILSNRLLHDDRRDMRQHLNNAFVFGLVFDGALHRSRGKSLADNPAYGSYIKYLIDKKEEYHRFFYDGTFVSPRDYPLPKGVWVAEYTYRDEHMFAFMNDNAESVTFDFSGHTVTIGGEDVACLVLSGETYD